MTRRTRVLFSLQRRPRINHRNPHIREVSHVARRERGVPREGDACNLCIADVHGTPRLLSLGHERRRRGRRGDIELQPTVLQVVLEQPRKRRPDGASSSAQREYRPRPRRASNTVMLAIHTDSAGLAIEPGHHRRVGRGLH